MPIVASRRSTLSYAAGVVAIATLMAIVALAGTTVTVRQTVNDPFVQQVTVQKQP